MVTVLLITREHPRAIASIEPPAGRPAASYPLATPSADIPPLQAKGTDTVEVCGHGLVSTSAIFQHVGSITKGAGTRWLSALQNSDDLRARVAGLLLDGKVTGGESLRPVTEQARNEVVQLAAGARDPAVYAMALSMCDSAAATDSESACRQLSLQQWARMDPDNAVPWLLLAGKARARGDSTAEAEAFSHVATAYKIDSYSDSVFDFAEPELPADVTPLERSYLATEVMGVEAAIRLPQYSVASHYCSSNAMQDSTVQQQCNSMAELLVSKGSNLLDLAIGKTIGERAGWPSERIKKLVLEQHALMQSIMQQAPSDEHDMWTCDAVSRVNTFVIQRTRLGELGAARDLLERSGDTAEEMAQKYIDHIDNIKRDALRQEQQNSPASAE